MRSGTLAPALCVGMGAAARICREDMDIDRAWIERLSEKLKSGIAAKMEHVTLNGDADRRYPGNLNFSFAYVEGGLL